MCSLRGKDFQRILAEEFGVQRSLTAVYNLLHSLGYSYLRPRPIHRKSDPAAIEEFKQQWPEKLKSIAASHPDKQLQVYFQDESRFGQQGTTTSVWAITTYGDPANRVPVSVGHRNRLSSDRTSRRADQSATEYGNHQPLPGSVLTYVSA